MGKVLRRLSTVAVAAALVVGMSGMSASAHPVRAVDASTPTACVSSAPARAGTVHCVTPATGTPAAPPVAVAAANCVAFTVVKDRFRGCAWNEYEYTVRLVPQNTVVGVARIRVVHENTLVFNDRAWQHKVNVTLLAVSGTLTTSPVHAQVGLRCDQACDADEFTLPRILTLGETLTITYDVTAPGTAPVRTKQTVTVSFSTPLPTPQPPAVATPPVLTGIRCDNSSSINSTPRGGCVYEDQVPSFRLSLSDPTVNETAAHIRDAQAASTHHWGLAPSGTKLKRLTNTAQVQRNRNRACPANVPRPPGKSCDEFPFASTYQGADMEGAGDFSARMVDAQDNSRAGTKLGQAYRENRILDGDAFWVAVGA